MSEQPIFDVLIIGGSYAGLSAALGLGRALRQVLVLDADQPCNRQTPHAHNFLTQDGRSPAELRALAQAQVLAYPSVQLRAATALAVAGADAHFTVALAEAPPVQARKLLLATGIRDLLPALPGYAACWGISVIHCPYCHGYEYRNEPTGLLLNGAAAFEMGCLLRNWTDQLTIFTDGPATLSAAHQAQLAALGIGVEQTPVREFRHKQGYLTHLGLADGRQLPLRACYARPPFAQQPVVEALGCRYTEAGYLHVDAGQQTSVPGIYAVGDATTPLRALNAAVAAGSLAAATLNRALLGLA